MSTTELQCGHNELPLGMFLAKCKTYASVGWLGTALALAKSVPQIGIVLALATLMP
jgi:hypothetical protein